MTFIPPQDYKSSFLCIFYIVTTMSGQTQKNLNPRDSIPKPRQRHSSLISGLGPRSCIGMRFALTEIKIALVKFLMKNTFVRSPETQVPLEILAGVTLIPKHGVHVKIEGLRTICLGSPILFLCLVWLSPFNKLPTCSFLNFET